MSSDLSDWRSRPFLTIPETAKVLGTSRGSTYSAAKKNQLPTVIFNDRKFVPTASLRRLIGEELETAVQL